MPTTTKNRERFEACKARYRKARERRDTFRRAMLDKYGRHDPPHSWLMRGEVRKLEAIERAEERASDAFFALMDTIGGRNWRTHAPHWWILEHLSFEDATTRGQLSRVPPAAYGYNARDMENFAAPMEDRCPAY